MLYNTPKSEIIDQVCIPYSVEMNQEEFRKNIMINIVNIINVKRQKILTNINWRIG